MSNEMPPVDAIESALARVASELAEVAQALARLELQVAFIASALGGRDER